MAVEVCTGAVRAWSSRRLGAGGTLICASIGGCPGNRGEIPFHVAVDVSSTGRIVAEPVTFAAHDAVAETRFGAGVPG